MAEQTLKEKVSALIASEVRPSLQADGGDIELIDVTADGIVKVKLRGACAGCPGARMTLQMIVQSRLQKKFPEIKGIEAV